MQEADEVESIYFSIHDLDQYEDREGKGYVIEDLMSDCGSTQDLLPPPNPLDLLEDEDEDRTSNSNSFESFGLEPHLEEEKEDMRFGKPNRPLINHNNTYHLCGSFSSRLFRICGFQGGGRGEAGAAQVQILRIHLLLEKQFGDS